MAVLSHIHPQNEYPVNVLFASVLICLSRSAPVLGRSNAVYQTGLLFFDRLHLEPRCGRGRPHSEDEKKSNQDTTHFLLRA